MKYATIDFKNQKILQESLDYFWEYLEEIIEEILKMTLMNLLISLISALRRSTRIRERTHEGISDRKFGIFVVMFKGRIPEGILKEFFEKLQL